MDVIVVALKVEGHPLIPDIRHRQVNVALYAGMPVSELEQMLKTALAIELDDPMITCSGFYVSTQGKQSQQYHHRRHASSSHGGRIIPLSLACAAPELLQHGYVTVLFSSSTASGSFERKKGEHSNGKATTAATISDGNAERTMTQQQQQHHRLADRIARVIAALRDDKALTSFEAAVLTELCEAHQQDVLKLLKSSKTIAQKKQKLLEFLHAGGESGVIEWHQEEHANNETPREQPPQPIQASNQTTSITPPLDLQVELVCKKVTAIARTVFSPQVQSDIIALANSYRQKNLGKQFSETSFSQMMELMGVLERLLNKHALAEEHGASVLGLILAENRLLLSALEVYKRDQNRADLETTVKQIADLGATLNGGKSPRANRKSKTRSNGREQSLPSPQKRNGSTPTLKSKPKVFAHDVLKILRKKKMMTSLEFDIVEALVKQHDTQVFMAIQEYQQGTRSLGGLRDTLVSIVEEITMELGDEEKPYFMHSDDDGYTGNGDNGDDNAMEWQNQLLGFVRVWCNQQLLSMEHVEVLEKLIDERHNLLQSAYEVYVSDEDESELFDTLQRIAKLQLQAQEGVALHMFSQIVDNHCDVLQENEKELVKQLFARKNELVRAAWEVFDVEKNISDLGDTLLRITRFTSRKDSKLRLVEVVGEMMRRNLIRSHEADGLIQLFEAKNEALMAANEAFDSDGDVKELVETLLLIVKHANFGEPPLCTSPRHATTTSSQVSDKQAYPAGSDQLIASRLIQLLTDKRRLATWQNELLLALIAKNDDRLLAAIDLYNEDQNARELVDTLLRLCDLCVGKLNKDKIIQEWIIPLQKCGRIDNRDVLCALVETEDPRVIAAFVIYLEDGNGEEFADTLVRVSRLEAASTGYDKRPSSVATEDADGDLKLDIKDTNQILTDLVHAGMLSMPDRTIIQELLMAGDPQALAAFDVYQETTDKTDLADTFQRILARRLIQYEQTEAAMTAASISKISSMEKQLLHFASEVKLSPAELDALKRSIARKDPILEAAVEVFEMENDEEDLKDTLRRVAVHLVEAESQRQ